MPETFGSRLRGRREARAIPLRTIAEQTKIQLSLLEALERDDVSRWPSGLFRRAYIRAYAQAIGLDPDIVVREFLETHPEKPEVVETLSAIASATTGSRPPAGASRLRALGSAIASFARSKPGSSAERSAPPGEDETIVEEGARRVGALKRPEPSVGDPGHVTARPPVPAVAGRPTAPDDLELSEESLRSDEASFAGRLSLAEGPWDANPLASEPDFLALSRVCTEIGRARNTGDVQRQLPEAARVLDATGVIVWVWDMLSGALRPALVHGYSQRVLSQLPPVRRDADNATATAFRQGRTCAVKGEAGASGALALPLLTPGGCGGVLAIELRAGCEQSTCVRAAAEILAALLAQLVIGSVPIDEPQNTSRLPQQLPLSSLLP